MKGQVSRFIESVFSGLLLTLWAKLDYYHYTIPFDVYVVFRHILSRISFDLTPLTRNSRPLSVNTSLTWKNKSGSFAISVIGTCAQSSQSLLFKHFSQFMNSTSLI
jgi:hypothetical protein